MTIIICVTAHRTGCTAHKDTGVKHLEFLIFNIFFFPNNSVPSLSRPPPPPRRYPDNITIVFCFVVFFSPRSKRACPTKNYNNNISPDYTGWFFFSITIRRQSWWKKIVYTNILRNCLKINSGYFSRYVKQHFIFEIYKNYVSRVTRQHVQTFDFQIVTSLHNFQCWFEMRIFFWKKFMFKS